MATYKLDDKLKELREKKPKPLTPQQVMLQEIRELHTKMVVVRATLRSHESRLNALEEEQHQE